MSSVRIAQKACWPLDALIESRLNMAMASPSNQLARNATRAAREAGLHALREAHRE